MDANKKIFTEIIKRQMAILGPEITLSRVRNVPGIEVNESGDVINTTGDSQVLLQELINQFVELSGLIVKKTMESILANHPNDMVIVGQAPVVQIAYGLSADLAQAPAQPITPIIQSNPLDPSSDSEANNPAVQNSIHHDDSNPGDQDQSMASANKELEDLNKMLNNKTG